MKTTMRRKKAKIKSIFVLTLYLDKEETTYTLKILAFKKHKFFIINVLYCFTSELFFCENGYSQNKRIK